MTKIELVETISRVCKLTKQQTDGALYGLELLVQQALSSGESIKIPGIGTFTPQQTAPRTARNPRTGAEISVPAKIRVAFSASATLKKHLNP